LFVSLLATVYRSDDFFFSICTCYLKNKTNEKKTKIHLPENDRLRYVIGLL
jgi:hypothetical protein